jgi:hypothetical protein
MTKPGPYRNSMGETISLVIECDFDKAVTLLSLDTPTKLPMFIVSIFSFRVPLLKILNCVLLGPISFWSIILSVST